ncbi:MAG: hypothetical protein A3F12_02555 [Gammaproteobacteria bacterium RIFCSPHIGHO2_12_FULL_38_14]|nr:MAG: hypothetical protein A3F12_02555 [Gammaproteobacteria bacterium RIFCSPHIGHO2_12_FULL_38_14]
MDPQMGGISQEEQENKRREKEKEQVQHAIEAANEFLINHEKITWKRVDEPESPIDLNRLGADSDIIMLRKKMTPLLQNAIYKADNGTILEFGFKDGGKTATITIPAEVEYGKRLDFQKYASAAMDMLQYAGYHTVTVSFAAKLQGHGPGPERDFYKAIEIQAMKALHEAEKRKLGIEFDQNFEVLLARRAEKYKGQDPLKKKFEEVNAKAKLAQMERQLNPDVRAKYSATIVKETSKLDEKGKIIQNPDPRLSEVQKKENFRQEVFRLQDGTQILPDNHVERLKAVETQLKEIDERLKGLDQAQEKFDRFMKEAEELRTGDYLLDKAIQQQTSGQDKVNPYISMDEFYQSYKNGEGARAAFLNAMQNENNELIERGNILRGELNRIHTVPAIPIPPEGTAGRDDAVRNEASRKAAHDKAETLMEKIDHIQEKTNKTTETLTPRPLNQQQGELRLREREQKITREGEPTLERIRDERIQNAARRLGS